METAEITTQADELRAGRTIIVNTVGKSMQPLLYENDTQVVVAPLQKPLKKGNIVLYENEIGDPILHRVVAVSESSLTIRGDNTFRLETVPSERIAGVATEIIRHGKNYPTNGWEMRFYAVLVAGVYPLRKGYRSLKRKCAAVLPRPVVRAVRTILRKLRK